MAHLRDRRAFGNIGTRKFRGARFGDALSPRFSGLLDQYGGAAAAYSLRALSSGWLAGDVVELRRSSDSTSDTFTAGQITGGQMLDFVNTPVWTSAVNATLDPYDTFTGTSISGFSATLAAGLGHGGFGGLTGTSGQTVSVSFDLVINGGSPAIALRPSKSSAVARSNSQVYATSGSYTIDLVATADFGFIGFSDTTVPCDFVVSNFEVTAITADGFVSTWYDQSGNANNATQATTTKQPKIVSAGALVVGGLDFDGTDDSLGANAVAASFTGTDQPLSAFAVGTVDVSKAHYLWTLGNSTNDTSFMGAGENSGPYRAIERDETATLVNISGGTFSSESLVTYITTGNQRELFADGASIISDSTNLAAKAFDQFQVGRLLRTTAAGYWNGKISTVVLYDSDQTANRVGIEAIINAL
jgi:hypothetical protein